MKKNFVNQENFEGRVYEHDLSMKTVQNKESKNFGTPFINGSVTVVTDEAGLNALTVHYTYVTETTAKGTPNPTFANLKRIMEGKTWVANGKDEAIKVRLTPSAALNDFYPQGGDQLVSQQRNEGGFVNILTNLNAEGPNRQKFIFDAVIVNVTHVEADENRGIDNDYAKIDCRIFNFRNSILPFTVVARDPAAINYFEGLEASKSEPVFTQIWGEVVSTTVKVKKEIESAFGAPTVDISERQQREWIVTGARPVPYDFDTEDTITKADLAKMAADRNVYLEEVKTRAKEYYGSKGNAIKAATPTATNSGPVANTTIPVGGFDF